MNGGQRIVLENDARLGKVRGQLLHVGLRLFAVGALEVGKLDQFQILRCRPAIWTVRTLLQLLTVGGIRMIAEGQNIVTGNDMLSIRQRKEGKGTRLLLAQ